MSEDVNKLIEKINNEYEYEDANPQGKGDADLVSCGQCGGYNELLYIYNAKLKPLVDKDVITKDAAVKALGQACKDLDNPRTRSDFYNKLNQILGLKGKDKLTC